MRRLFAQTSLVLSTIHWLMPALRPEPGHGRVERKPVEPMKIATLGIVQQPAGHARRLTDGGNLPTHAVFEVTLQPGASLPDDYSYTSIVVTVLRGQVEAASDGGVASTFMGSGRPIRQGLRGKVFCDQAGCDLPDATPVVLGAGNGLSVTGGTVTATATGKRRAVLQLSLVLTETDTSDPLCWICPRITTSPF